MAECFANTSGGTPSAPATNTTGRPPSRGSVSCPPVIETSSVSVADDASPEVCFAVDADVASDPPDEQPTAVSAISVRNASAEPSLFTRRPYEANLMRG